MSTMTATENSDEKKKLQRDWFGYILTAVIGMVVTVLATWYQLSVTEREATAAELERARAVRQSVIAIVEEQALNGLRLEADRISRLVDQRRREQKVSLQIPTMDVVEQAEFNIASSTHLSVDRKEQIKYVFDKLYAEAASRSFQAFAETDPNSALLNELVKQIQEGKTAPALANLRRLHQINIESIESLSKKAKPGVFEALQKFFNDPLNFFLFIAGYAILLRLMFNLRKRRRIEPYGGRLL